jgi:hypothetical protein
MAEYRLSNRVNFNDQNDRITVITGQVPGRLNPEQLPY